ncbi:MAG: hypothetical protein ACE5D6_06670 [Candidatus Zixiibacteriota bacterium]
MVKKNYQNLLDKGKPKMVALTACMRKLLIMSQAILIKEKTYKHYTIDLKGGIYFN